MEDRSENLHSFYASLVCAAAKVRGSRIEQAFRAVKREPFVGPGPWLITLGGHDYVKTPNDDPAFIYQNALVALDSAQGLNIGMPSAHAYWLDGCDLKEGETVLQVGVGTGYYTAILAHLVGPSGQVHAYEIDESLADRARDNLKDLPQVNVQARSGISPDLPKVDLIYVCAGAAQPAEGVARCVASRWPAVVSACARRRARRDAAGQTSRSGRGLAGGVLWPGTVHRLCRSSGRGCRPSSDGSVSARLGTRAVAPAR